MPSLVVYTPPATEPVTVAEVMQRCRIDTVNQEPAPGAPSVALGSGSGNVDNGAHRYRVTFVTADGETQGGDISAAVTVSDKSVNGKIELSGIPLGGSLVTARKIYRTTANGSAYLLLATIANNTATTYTDNIADINLGASVPSTNATGDPELRLLISAVRQKAESILKRYLITQTVDMYLDCFESWEIRMPPLQSVTSIVYTDGNGIEQTLSASDYQVDSVGAPARITPAYNKTWPETREQMNAVRIRFVAGYGTAADVPECVRDWMLKRIKHAYDNRDPVNVGNIVTEFPHSYVDGMLEPERVYGV
ncbi:head-tail connector protein [Nitrosomonas oligotropha]|uniref:head-tail connector protein n=1 Tax=Nitrosomonas oligotropha TaxID=42354 RepID=UPI00136D1249|nr:hypothetical protein [Nitrosomonas oligotropha]MXS81572.1 hypothetical protein [Nitrosomonas oligotropha]